MGRTPTNKQIRKETLSHVFVFCVYYTIFKRYEFRRQLEIETTTETGTGQGELVSTVPESTTI